ncbi:hypothetical protein L2E82_51771 [Cichorium intybus]|nr:hypothetical protein L2E82_51771 [Cichorium intybus]
MNFINDKRERVSNNDEEKSCEKVNLEDDKKQSETAEGKIQNHIEEETCGPDLKSQTKKSETSSPIPIINKSPTSTTKDDSENKKEKITSPRWGSPIWNKVNRSEWENEPMSERVFFSKIGIDEIKSEGKPGFPKNGEFVDEQCIHPTHRRRHHQSPIRIHQQRGPGEGVLTELQGTPLKTPIQTPLPAETPLPGTAGSSYNVPTVGIPITPVNYPPVDEYEAL